MKIVFLFDESAIFNCEVLVALLFCLGLDTAIIDAMTDLATR